MTNKELKSKAMSLGNKLASRMGGDRKYYGIIKSQDYGGVRNG
jgi:hypothetical protein